MIELNNTTSYPVQLKKINLVVANFLRLYQKKEAVVSLALVGAARMKTLNYQYRQLAKTTDVLSFSADKTSAKNYLGEIIINTAELKKYRKYREMFQEIGEDYLKLRDSKKYSGYLFYFLLVHGLLHLVGYDDETAAGHLEMLRLGRDFLAQIF